MRRLPHLVLTAAFSLLACGTAMAQQDDAGSIVNNRNTTNSLAGINDRADPFFAPPVVVEPAPGYGDGGAPTPRTDAGEPAVSRKGPRNGFGLTDQ